MTFSLAHSLTDLTALVHAFFTSAAPAIAAAALAVAASPAASSTAAPRDAAPALPTTATAAFAAPVAPTLAVPALATTSRPSLRCRGGGPGSTDHLIGRWGSSSTEDALSAPETLQQRVAPLPRAMSATENALALIALRRIPDRASLSASHLRRVWLRPPERDEIFHGFHVGWSLVRGPTVAPVIAVAKILASPREVWIDELAADGSGSALARWALLSALETALDARLTAAQATVRLQVAMPSQLGTPSAHGLYRTQLELTDGVPAYEGPWHGHSPMPGHVLMHGIVGQLIARLRVVLYDRQPPAGTQFFWRFSLGTLPLAISPATATSTSNGNPLSSAHTAASLAAAASAAAAALAITASDEATSAAIAVATVATFVTTGSSSTLTVDVRTAATTAAAAAASAATASAAAASIAASSAAQAHALTALLMSLDTAPAPTRAVAATTPTRATPREAAPVPSAPDPSAKDVADADAFANAIVSTLAHGSASAAVTSVPISASANSACASSSAGTWQSAAPAQPPGHLCDWEDEEELLAAIALELNPIPKAAAPKLLDDDLSDDDTTDVPPAPHPPPPHDEPRATALRMMAAAATLGSAPAHPALAHAAGTAALVSTLMPPAPPPIQRAESLLIWNAAGWWSGDGEAGSDEHQATAAARYDVLAPVLRGHDAPTYLVLNEINGSLRDFNHSRGLGAWLGAAGYGHYFYPGGTAVRQRLDGSAGATGGLLLAWLRRETSPCGPPLLDPRSMTIAGDFRHRRCAADAPPMRIVAAYGAHKRNGKVQAINAIVRHVMQTRGCLAAGDLNVTPGPTWRRSARRQTAADDAFEAITGGGELDDGTAMTSIVDLGLDHARGQFSRAHWTARLADGTPKGTATLDHVLTAGLERGSWVRRAAWFAFDDAQGLVSDHMIVIVERAPRSVMTDDCGVHRLPRYLVEKWQEHQTAAFVASFESGLQQLRAGMWRAHAEDAPQRLATGAAAVVQLVALINHAACAAEAARRGDPRRDCTRRIYDAGGGIPGIRAQLKRQQGVLQVIRKARLAVVQAAHALAALVICGTDSPRRRRQ